jgi:hypothetical protein
MDDRQRQLTEFLDQHVNLPKRVAGRAFAWHPPIDRPTAAELAGQLLATAEFRALGLGTWLGTPDGEFFTAAVEAVSPPFYRQDEELIVEALKLAAKMQSGNRRAAGALALGAVVAGIFLISRG